MIDGTNCIHLPTIEAACAFAGSSMGGGMRCQRSLSLTMQFRLQSVGYAACGSLSQCLSAAGGLLGHSMVECDVYEDAAQQQTLLEIDSGVALRDSSTHWHRTAAAAAPAAEAAETRAAMKRR